MKRPHHQAKRPTTALATFLATMMTITAIMALTAACSAGGPEAPEAQQSLPETIQTATQTLTTPPATQPEAQQANLTPTIQTDTPTIPEGPETTAQPPNPTPPRDETATPTIKETPPAPTSAPPASTEQPPAPTITPVQTNPTQQPEAQPLVLTIEPAQASIAPGQEWTPTELTLHLADGSTSPLRPDAPGTTWSLQTPTGHQPIPATMDINIKSTGTVTITPMATTATILATATHQGAQATARLDIRANTESEACTHQAPRADLLLELHPQTPTELIPHMVNSLNGRIKARYPSFSALLITITCVRDKNLQDALARAQALQPVTRAARYSPTPGDLQVTQITPIFPEEYSSVTMRPGQILPLPVHQALFSDSSIRTMPSQDLAQVNYAVKDTKVVEITPSAQSLRALEPGATTMTIAHQGDTLADITVMVTDDPNASVTTLRAAFITAGIPGQPILLHPGQHIPIQVKATTHDGRTVTLDPRAHTVTFRSASFRITVDESGKATARESPRTPLNTSITVTHDGLIAQSAIHLRPVSPPIPKVDQDCRHQPEGTPGPIPGNLFVVEMPWTQDHLEEPDHPLLAQAETITLLRHLGQRHPHQLISLPCDTPEQLDRAHQALLLHPQVARATPYLYHPDNITITQVTPSLTIANPYPGMQVPLQATVHLSNGTRRTATPGEIANFRVTSDSPSVISISPLGTVTTEAPGQATLQIQHQGTHQSIKVTVLPIPLSPTCAYLKHYTAYTQQAQATVVDLSRVQITLTKGSGPSDAQKAAETAGGSIPRDRIPTIGRTKYTAVLHPPCHNPWQARWNNIKPFVEAPDTILQHPNVASASHPQADTVIQINPPEHRPGFLSAWDQAPPAAAKLTDIVTHVHRLNNVNPQTPVHIFVAGQYANGSTGRLRSRDLADLRITSLDPDVLQATPLDNSRTDPVTGLLTRHSITAIASGRGRLLLETSGTQETVTVRVRSILGKQPTLATDCTDRVRDRTVIRDQIFIRTSPGTTGHQALAIAHEAGAALLWSSGDGLTHLLQQPCRSLTHARQQAWHLTSHFSQVERAHPHIITPQN